MKNQQNSQWHQRCRKEFRAACKESWGQKSYLHTTEEKLEVKKSCGLCDMKKKRMTAHVCLPLMQETSVSAVHTEDFSHVCRRECLRYLLTVGTKKGSSPWWWRQYGPLKRWYTVLQPKRQPSSWTCSELLTLYFYVQCFHYLFFSREDISHTLIYAAENLWQESFFLFHCSFSLSCHHISWQSPLSIHSFVNFRPCIFIGPSFTTDFHVEHSNLPPNVLSLSSYVFNTTHQWPFVQYFGKCPSSFFGNC
jgi:hypothetical protein